MTKMTDTERAELIERGCKLDRRIKKATNELSIIKEQMKDWKEGMYGTANGSQVQIACTTVYTDPDPTDVYKWFKRNLTIKEFLRCIKVQVTEAKRIMGETMFNKYRTAKPDKQVRISFKTVSKLELEATANAKFNGKTRLLKV